MKQRGYFELPTEKGVQLLHFSANAWYNLLEDTGKQVDQFGRELDKEYSKKKQDVLKILNLLTDLAYAAAKAHDQEAGNDIAYNRFNVRTWMANLTAEDSEAFVAAMLNANTPPKQESGN